MKRRGVGLIGGGSAALRKSSTRIRQSHNVHSALSVVVMAMVAVAVAAAAVVAAVTAAVVDWRT